MFKCIHALDQPLLWMNTFSLLPLQNLSNCPWYFGSLVRQQAANKIEALRQASTVVLLMVSCEGNQMFTMVSLAM